MLRTYRSSRGSRCAHKRANLRWGNTQLSLHQLEERSVPAVFTVTNDAEGVVMNPGDLPGSLRQAIFDANTTPGADVIEFGSFFATPQTITLANGELAITEGVSINGPGTSNLTLSGGSAFRAFNIDGPGIMPVNINKMTILNGLSSGGLVGNRGGAIQIQNENVTLSAILFQGNQAPAARGGAVNLAAAGILNIDSCTFNGNFSGVGGGAIHVAAGTLNLNNSTLSGNTTNGRGGALYLSAGTANVANTMFDVSSGTPNSANGQGGTVNAVGGTLVINNSLITGSKSGSRGAGIYSFGTANTTIRASTISNCSITTSNGGGGISALGGTLLVQDSNITGNSAASRGGGIYATNVNLTVDRCFISGNTAVTQTGGGICLTTNSNNVIHTVQNSTIQGNTATLSGGGIAVYIADGLQFIRNNTISGNTANGTVAGQGGGGLFRSSGNPLVESNIIAGNIATAGPDVLGTITANNNLVQNATGATLTGTGNVTGVDPGLSAPAFNGGLTKTMLPANPGPAIDAGSNNAGLATDQRGLPRVAGAKADIGAVEIQSPGIPTASVALSEVTSYGGTTYQFKVVYSDDTGFDTTTFDNSDIRVTGPNGFDQLATKTSVTGSGTSYTVTYTITPPGGSWDQGEFGLYQVALEPNQVKDDGGNSLPAATLGNFVVDGRSYVVTTNADSGPGSLRQGLLNANTFSSTDTITFDPSLTGTTITVSSTLPISAATTITGLGADKLAISGGNTVRIFSVGGPARPVINISGLTLTQAKTANLTTDRGAAMTIADETVNITDVVFTANNTQGRGGALALAGNGVLNLTRVLFTNNTAALNAGALHLASGTTTITDSTFKGNTAAAGGGAIHMEASSLTLDRVTISGNTGTQGGGLSTAAIVAANVITIRNSTISGNTATAAAGGGGIGLATFAGKLQVQSSTIANNKSTSATGGGGGIAVISTSGTPTITLDSTIVSNNTGTTGPDIKGTITSASYSWIGNPAGATITTSTAVLNGDPLLLPLTNNGGLTETHALAPGSLAINAGKNVAALTVDQRGFAREVGTIDIGSYEADNFTAKLNAPNVSKAGDTVYTFTVTFADAQGIDVSTLDNQDIRVTNSAIGFDQLATFVSVTPAGNGQPRTATYSIVPPGGSWDAADIGEYTVLLETDQVKNAVGTSAPAGALGTFKVGIPANLLVTNLNDDGLGSLRAAITAANLNFPSNDTITIDSSLNGTVTMALGEMAITDGVSIVYSGTGKFALDAGGLSRVFNIDNGATSVIDVSITGLTITKGSVAADGGGVFIANENVTFDRSVITDNSTSTQGGGIGVGTGGSLTLRNSTLSGNHADDIANGFGGGVYFINGGNLTVENSTVSGNTAAQQGAGLYFFGTATNGTVLVRNSTISGNVSGSDGAGIAVVSFVGNLLVQNSTVAFNNATGGFGGGIAQDGGAGTMTLESSIVAKNTNQFAPDVGGFVTANNSLIGSTFGGFVTGSNNKLNVDPLLNATLALNGGTTATHELLAGSPAINTGSNLAGLAFDQRGVGFDRNSGGGVDMGAFEIQVPTPPQIVSIDFNGGAAQRSMVTSVKVSFSESVTLNSGSFLFERYGKGTPGTVGVTVANQVGGDVTLTFNNTGSITLDPGGSLPDGQYQLTIVAGNVSDGALTLDGNKNGISEGSPTDNVTSKVHRLFGDGNGDGSVGAADFAQFRSVFGLSGPSIFDYNNDNNTGAADFAQFRARFGLGGFTP